MPFKSRAQQKMLFSKHPDVAEKFSEHTTKEEQKNLPEYVSDKNRLKAYTKKHRRKSNG